MPRVRDLFVSLTLCFAIFFVFGHLSALAEDESFRKNQILISFKKNQDDRSIEDFALKNGLILINKPKGGPFLLFEIKDGSSVASKMQDLRRNVKVRKVQPNFIFRMEKKKTGSTKKKKGKDTLYDRQWWIYNDGHLGGKAGSDTFLTAVWNMENKAWREVLIGIIDTGVNSGHGDIAGNIRTGYDFVHHSSKKVDDKDGHGSFISGLVAAQVRNKTGIAGMSRLNKLKIVPLKFDFSTSQAVEAIVHAKNMGVRILNMSWGTEEYDPALYDAIKSFPGVVIASAGNDGREHDASFHFYPCDFDLPNVVCVGAVSENDSIASYSDFGAQYVDLLAPGGEGLPLVSLGLRKNDYYEGRGTSYATAFVSGTAGLVLSASPFISNSELIDAIINNVRPVGGLESKVRTGGVLNSLDAVKRLK